MVTFTIEMLGEERFIRVFSRIGAEVDDFSTVFGDIYRDFTAMNRTNWDFRGYPKGWVPLSPKYAAWKEKHFPGRPLMVLRGNLKASLASTAGDPGMGTWAIREIQKKDAYFGSRAPYAAAHQYGYPPRHLPKRQVVQITDTDKVRWSKIIHKWSVDLLKAGTVAGGGQTPV